jgi:dolichol-phosphate mannosyltransferase
VTGFLYAGVVIVNALAGRPPQGWGSLMVVVLVIGGIQMLMMGVLGEYLWRALDESRRRPPYIVEAVCGNDEAPLQTGR